MQILHITACLYRSLKKITSTMRLKLLTVAPSTFRESSMVNLTVDADEPSSGKTIQFFASNAATRNENSVELGSTVINGDSATFSFQVGASIVNLAATSPSKADRIASTGTSITGMGMDLDKIKSIFFIAYSPDMDDSIVAEASYYPPTAQFWPSNSVVSSSMREGENVAIGQSLVIGGTYAPSGATAGINRWVLIGGLVVILILGIVAIKEMSEK